MFVVHVSEWWATGADQRRKSCRAEKEIPTWRRESCRAQREDSVYAKKKIRTYHRWCAITRAKEDDDLCRLSCPKKKQKPSILGCRMKERSQCASLFNRSLQQSDGCFCIEHPKRAKRREERKKEDAESGGSDGGHGGERDGSNASVFPIRNEGMRNPVCKALSKMPFFVQRPT